MVFSNKVIHQLFDKYKSSESVKAFLIYGFSNIMIGLSPFLMTPILTRYLTKEEFGSYYLFLSLFNILTIIATMNAHVAVTVNYNKLSSIDFKTFFSSLIIIPLVFIVLSISITFVFSITDLFEIDYYLVLFCVASAFFNAYILYSLSYFQISVKPKLFFFTRAFQTLFDIIIALGFLTMFNDSFEARIESHFLTIAFTSIFCLSLLYKIGVIVRSVNPIYIKKSLLFGMPLIPHSLAALVIMNTDRYFLTEILDASSSGLFSSVLIIAGIMMLYIEPVNKAFAPWLLSKLENGNSEDKFVIVRFTYGLSISFILFALLLFVVKDFLYYIIVQPEYYSTKEIFPIVLLGFCFQGMYYLVTNYLLHSEKTKTLASITVFVSIVGSALSFILITNFGIYGASYSFMVTNLILFALVWYFSARSVKMPWFSSKRLFN